MKKILIILTLVLVGYSAFFWFVLDRAPRSPEEPTTEVVVEEVPVVNSPVEENKMCFAREQEATESAPYAVEEYVEIVMQENMVSGMKSGSQSGPDMTNGYEGTLTGEIVDNVIVAIFNYTIEGSNQKEKEEYIFKNQNLVKLRYPLKDESGLLVPDKTKEATEIIYIKSLCR